MSIVDIYTDGACSGNPGPGGWGLCAAMDNNIIHSNKGYDTSTTNNRMELEAFLDAVEWASKYVDETDLDAQFTIYTDSRYVADSCNKGWLLNWKASQWKKSSGGEVLNRDIWEQVAKALYEKDFSGGLRLSDRVTVSWCKGHTGILGNEHADTIACNARDEAKKMLALIQIDAETSDDNSNI